MDRPTWMPENPYEGEIDIFQNIRLASRQGFDEGSIKTARSILKFLSKWVEDNSKSEVGVKFASMLKELERLK